MPPLSDAINFDRSGYVPVSASAPTNLPPPSGLEPILNSMIRCPLPPIFQAEPDSLRQFYQGGIIPQTRLLSAVTNGINGGGGGGNAVVSTAIVVPSGGGVVPPPVQTIAQQAVLTTGVLGPGQQFIGTLVSLTRSFQLLNVSTSIAARVTIYGTSLSQLGDLYRGVDVPPPAGSTQGIITDVVLDTLPLVWQFQNRIGANGDTPQKQQAYVTVTNLSGAAVPITVTLSFVPLEN